MAAHARPRLMPGAKNGLNGSGHSLPTPPDSGDLGDLSASSGVEERELPPAPEAVLELCASCVRFVGTRYKVALDYTPETLPILDQYVRDARADVAERPETLAIVAAAAGAYLGEVMRKQFGGFWFAQGDHEAWRLYFTHVYLACNPLGMAVEALTLLDAEGWHSHFEVDPADAEAVAARLGALPDVEEEAFALPTTRMEALTVVHDTLRGHMEAQNTADVEFGPDDYR